MRAMMKIETYIPTPAQQAFHSAPQRYKLYGGAMGGGKSRALCEGAVEKCLTYPGNFVLLCRRTLSSLMQSTYLTLTNKSCMRDLLADKRLVKENQQRRVFSFWNGSKLFYGGLEGGQKGDEKIFSTEYGNIFVDEAFELDKDHYRVLKSRLRHALPDTSDSWHKLNKLGKKCPKYELCMASNPAQNWIKEEFITAPGPQNIFIPARAADNPYNPDDYEENLREIFHGDEQMYKAFVEGSWDAGAASDEVISDAMLKGAEDVPEHIACGRYISCDPGRFGDDMTVIYTFSQGKIINKSCFSKRDTMEIVGWMVSEDKETCSPATFVVDETGVGAGVVDRLGELRKPVIGINYSSKAQEFKRFYNKRAEMYWRARMLLIDRKLHVPIEDVSLRNQLRAVKFKFHSDGRIIIEDKDELKARLGRSPDEADSFVMGVDAMYHVLNVGINAYALEACDFRNDRAWKKQHEYKRMALV
jgi:phage terminase large subunit